MEFLEEKAKMLFMQPVIKVMNNDERQKKVAKHSEEALENLLNLNSGSKY